MKKLVFVLLACLLPLSLFAKDTVIYHTSDTHGFYYAQKGQGGFAALAAVLKNGPQNYLLLDSGDFSNGTVEAKNSKGLKSVEMLNALKYDAATIGNHEFDFKDSAVAPILAKAQFAILAANFVEAGSLKRPAHVESYKIFKRNGVKFAVIGLANTVPSKSLQQYVFTPSLAALEQTLETVEKQKPDVVVVLVHDSVADDKHGVDSSYVLDIARKFPGRVQVVLGGHAHKIIQNRRVDGTLFVESGCYTKNVSKITVTTDDKTGKFVMAKSELIPLYTQKTGEDKAILKLGNELREPGVDEVLGYTQEPMRKQASNPKFLDNSLDNWVADLGRSYADVEVFVVNTGGTRMTMPQGPVTKRDIINILPFENTVAKMSVDGRTLKRIVKSGLSKGITRFAYSGLSVNFVYNKKGKVKDLHIWVNNQPLENNRKYTLATNSFIAEGNMEGHIFKSIPETDKKQVGSKHIRQLMEEALRKSTPKNPIKPGPEGRVAER